MAVSPEHLTLPDGTVVAVTYVPAFSCPVCQRVSHHPDDADRGYCGNCHAFTRYLAETAGLLSEAGLAGAPLMDPGEPLAALHNGLVRLAVEVERSALQAARLVTAAAVLADLEAGDEMRWMPGCQEW